MASTETIRVMIVDDHAMVRSGLRLFLMGFDDFEPAGEAEDGAQAVAVAREGLPDVVLMDMVMPDVDGPEATRRLLLALPSARVIALTSFYERALVEEAFRAGAFSYLLKNVTAVELADAIRAAHAGRPTLAPEAASVLIRSTRQGGGAGDELTEREREVLDLIVEGLRNRDIARRLSISESTAKFHVSRILAKLGAKNRVEAVRLATTRGLVRGRRPSG